MPLLACPAVLFDDSFRTITTENSRRGGMTEQIDKKAGVLGAMLATGKHVFVRRWPWFKKESGDG